VVGGTVVLGTAACIVLEPCGLVEAAAVTDEAVNVVVDETTVEACTAAEEGTTVTGDALAQARSDFAAVRAQYWRDEAASNPDAYSAENLARMQQGRPPIGDDGYPMELHHDPPLSRGGTNDPATLRPMTRTQHRLGGNYKLNH
jgi:hypothetical protein